MNGPLTLLLCVDNLVVIGNGKDIDEFFEMARKDLKSKLKGS